MNLFFRKAGEGRPLVILHGLFGSSDNWYSLSKVFAEQFSVYTVDQRNHGQSPHSDEFNYKILAQDLEEFLNQQGIVDPIVIGHSMGGKTAMNLAIKSPNSIAKLIVVDIAPKSFSFSGTRPSRADDPHKELPYESILMRSHFAEKSDFHDSG